MTPSVPDAVKKKFSRSGGPSPDLSSNNSWGSEDTLEYDNSEVSTNSFLFDFENLGPRFLTIV